MKVLKAVWKKWLPIAQAIGNFNAQVILTIFYLVIILPLGIIFRLFADPLNIRRDRLSRQKSNFRKWEHPNQNLEEARKQY